MSGRSPTARQRSAIGPLLRELTQRFRDGSAVIPRAAWRTWRRTIAVGAIALFVFAALLRFAASWALARGLLDWESDFLLRLGAAPPLRFSSAVFFQTFGSDITLVILIVLTAGIAVWMRRPIIALSIGLALLGPDLVVRFGWAIWSRARPDLLYEGIASPGFHSFPSGHAAKTVAVYGLLTALWIRASGNALERICALLMLAFIAVVVPLGRVMMGVHWPSDVIAGAIIGGAWLAVLLRGLRCDTNVDAPVLRG